MKEPGFDFLNFQHDLMPAAGRLLVANPLLPDNNFKRTVVLLTEHNHEGTVGFVINKPVELTINDVVNDFPDLDAKLGYGGPVQLDTLHFLHSRGDLFDKCTQVETGIFWGGDFVILRTLLDTGQMSLSEVKFLVGYAGWKPNQLEAEIEEQSWIVQPADRSLVFEQDDETLWGRVLQRLGGHFALMRNYPEDPRLN